MKTCFVYVRVSTEDQAKYGYSIDAQKITCTEFAHKSGYEVIDTFADEGESATAIDRPEFQKMLNRCEEEHLDAIIVWHTDRFARNESDHYLVKDKLRKLGVSVLSVSQPMIDDSPEGCLMDGMMATYNAFYSRDLSRKTKKGLAQKWAEGVWPGWAPLGYKNIKDQNGKGAIAVDEATAPIIRKAISELYPTGNYSIYTLQKWLYDQGLRSKTNKVMQFSVVHNLLINPFYYGLMRSKTHGEKMGTHEPLITKEIYDMNQYILAKHRQFLTRERKYDYLLRGLIFCQVHNRRLVAEPHKINSKANPIISCYHCCQRGGCKGSYIRQEKLEQSVANQFKKFQFSQDFIDLVGKKCREILEKVKDDIEAQKRTLLNQRTGWEIKRETLETMLLDNTVDRDTFQRQHSRITTEINAVDIKLSDLERKRGVDLTLIDEVLAFTRDIYQGYIKAPKFLKRHYFRFFFEKILVADKKIVEVTATPLFLTLKKESKVILTTDMLPRVDSNHEPSSYKNSFVTKRLGLSHPR